MKPINTIDEVIDALQNIIDESIHNQETFGYFVALYLKVTKEVKIGIAENRFENGPRMEKLDVIFAKRYIDAYYNYRQNKSITSSWKKAFNISDSYWPIVLQHLLIGMNAHINLDLGIAAAEVSKNHPIENLKKDFDTINTILSSLVNDVEKDLSEIYPFLKKILKYTKKVDNFLVDFSMEIARDGAWNFAVELSKTEGSKFEKTIESRDKKVADTARIIINPGLIVNIIFVIIRLGERGSVKQKVMDLMK